MGLNYTIMRTHTIDNWSDLSSTTTDNGENGRCRLVDGWVQFEMRRMKMERRDAAYGTACIQVERRERREIYNGGEGLLGDAHIRNPFHKTTNFYNLHTFMSDFPSKQIVFDSLFLL